MTHKSSIKNLSYNMAKYRSVRNALDTDPDTDL